jgi:hypothetical protein
MTTTRAYGKGFPPISLRPLKICTEVTRLKSNMSGTPSSVKAQMNTMMPPAKKPGMMSGRVIFQNFRIPVQPRFSAASSMAGSTLASAATRLRYRIGYRCSAFITTPPKRRLGPSQSTGWSGFIM